MHTFRSSVVFLCMLLCFLPQLAQAAVTINEVAWMGSATSANDEWIELHNDGAAVDVTNWTLSDNMGLSISLSGTIAAGAYAVLERTNDDSAPGPAFLIYTGALTNAGATLTLTRADGSIKDQVAGGDNWDNIGGDNSTKETAQYTPSGWITAAPTPGAENKTENSSAVSAESTITGSGTLATPISVPDQTFYTDPRSPTLAMTVPTQGDVDQPIEMNVSTTGVSQIVIDSLQYQWNFGDISTSSGQTVTHRFRYPGQYVVTVHAHFHDYEAKSRAVITILPTPLAITTNEVGDVQVHNAAKYEVDLSHYVVRAGRSIELPEGTILLANSTVTIPRQRIAYTGQVVSVLDPVGRPIVGYSPRSAAPITTHPVTAAAKILSPSTVDQAPAPAVTAPTVSSQAAAAGAALPDQSPAWPLSSTTYAYFGLAAVIALGSLALVAGAAKQPAVATEEVTGRTTSPFFDDEVRM